MGVHASSRTPSMGRACGRQTKSDHSHCVVDGPRDSGLGPRDEGRGHEAVGAVEASESREMAKGQARGRRRPAAGLRVPAQWWAGRGFRAACTTPRDRRGRKRRSIRPSSRRKAIGVGSGGVDGEDSMGIDIGGVQGAGRAGRRPRLLLGGDRTTRRSADRRANDGRCAERPCGGRPAAHRVDIGLPLGFPRPREAGPVTRVPGGGRRCGWACGRRSRLARALAASCGRS